MFMLQNSLSIFKGGLLLSEIFYFAQLVFRAQKTIQTYGRKDKVIEREYQQLKGKLAIIGNERPSVSQI